MPLLATKLQIPRARPTLVPRPRLWARLDEGATRKLTLVSAPAGFGKSTLLSEWVHRPSSIIHRPVAWLSLDNGDNDPTRFWTYVIEALRSQAGDLGQAALTMLQAAGLTTGPLEPALMTLVNELATRPSPLTLVLDDYHLIENAIIHRGMIYLLDHLPGTLHIVILTRSDPPFPLARLRVRQELVEIRADELRFTPAEVAAFLEQAGLVLSFASLTTLAARTEGWVAALHLVAVSLRDAIDPDQFVATFAGSHRYVFDYLVEEVLAQQPLAVQRFLWQTAILDRLTASLVEAVTGEPGGQVMLERLDRANLFLIPLDQTRGWYRYHHLFADVLRSQRPPFPSDDLSALHRRASAWYAEHGFVADAIQHSLAAADLAQAARLIDGVVEPMLWESGQIQTLMGWLTRLPDPLKQTWPRLTLIEGWLRLWHGQLAAVEPLLRSLAASSPSPAVQGQMAAIQAELAHLQGDIPRAITLGEQSLALLPADESRVRSLCLGILAGVYRLNGDLRQAQHAYTEASASMIANGQVIPALIALGCLVELFGLAGQPTEAARVYEQTLRHCETWHAQTLPMAGVAHLRMGEILWRQGQLDQAQTLLGQGINLCRQWGGLADYALEGCLSLATLLQTAGETEPAQAVIHQAVELAQTPEMPQFYPLRLQACQTRLRLLRGDRAAMDDRAWLALPDIEQGDADLVHYYEYLTLARLRLARGETDHAIRLLEKLMTAFEVKGLILPGLEALILLALAFYRRQDIPRALLTLHRALALAEPTGCLQPFLDEGLVMQTLLRVAETRDASTPLIQRLLLAFGATTATPPQSTPTLIEPLSHRELEILRLVAAGLTTNEVADRLVISVGTVRTHLKSIYGKLDAHTRLQAVDRARALHLLP